MNANSSTQQVTFSSEYHSYKQGGQFNVPAHPVISLSAGSANEGNQLVLTVTGRTSQWGTPGEKKETEGFKTHVLSKQGWQGSFSV